MFKSTMQSKEPISSQNLLSDKKTDILRNYTKSPSETQTYQKLQNLYQRKEQNYKQQIMKLIHQNQNYKLKQKQLIIKNTLIKKKLRLYVSEQQIQSYLNNPSEQKTLKNQNYQLDYKNKMESIKEKYKIQIETLLENYGCSKNQAKIDSFKTETQIIQFLITKFKQKVDDLKNYQIAMRGKLAEQQQQTQKIKETINIINETNEIYKSKQLNYKQKLDQVKRQWGLVCEKLSKRQLELEKVEKQLNFYRKKNLDRQNQTEKLQSHLKQQNYHLKQQLIHIKIKIAQLMNINSQNQAKYHHLYAQYQQIKINNEQLQNKLKICQQQRQRIQREVVRWKQRYQWLEKQRYQNQKKTITSQPFKPRNQEKWDILNMMKNQKTENQYNSRNVDALNKYIISYPSDEYIYSEQTKALNFEKRVKKMEQQLLGENLGISMSDNEQNIKQEMSTNNKKLDN